jgi:hypothetical protein
MESRNFKEHDISFLIRWVGYYIISG